MKKMHFSRKISAIIVFILVFGTIVALLVWGITTVVSEATNLLSGFNEYYEKISEQIQSIINNFKIDSIKITPEIKQMIQDTALSILQKFFNKFNKIFHINPSNGNLFCSNNFITIFYMYRQNIYDR